MAVALVLVCAASAAETPVTNLYKVQSLKRDVTEMFAHGFNSYIAYSFPSDMLQPVSCSALPRGEPFSHILGNYSLTLIDSLDSLIVFNRTADFITYGQYVIANVTFDTDVEVSLFEVVIRVLGGLLSAHVLQTHLSLIPDYENGFLSLAIDLAQRLVPAFHTPTGLPLSRINLRHGRSMMYSDTISTAEATTISLEFALLSSLSGVASYREIAETATRYVAQHVKTDTLPGTVINVFTGEWTSNRTTIGPGLDSYYEYLVKDYMAFGCDSCLKVFQQAYRKIRQEMLHEGWILDVNREKGSLESVLMSSLAAFWPSLEVMLGNVHFAVEMHALFYAIWAHYSALPDVLNLYEEELMYFGREYPLRPEFIESNFYLYQATHHPIFLRIAENLLSDLNFTTRTRCGFAGLLDVSKEHPEHIDAMESFFLSETLKYLYLTFEEAEQFYAQEVYTGLEFWCAGMCCETLITKPNIDIKKYVLTTEGHFVPLIRNNFELNVRVKGRFNFTCMNFDREELRLFISSELTPIWESHGQVNRSLPLTVPHRPKKLPAGVPTASHEVPIVLMRLLLLNESNIASELKASAGEIGRVFPSSLAVKLLLAEPQDACQRLNIRSEDARGKFVLVKRGKCLFAEKAFWVQQAGLEGMLVYDHRVVESSLITMMRDGNWPDASIYSAFITYHHSLVLLKAFRESEALSIVLAHP